MTPTHSSSQRLTSDPDGLTSEPWDSGDHDT